MPDLLIIRAPQQPEISVALNGQPIVIGADPACNVVVNDPTVLPHHAYVAPEQGAWRVTAYDANVALTFENKLVPELRLEKPTRFAIGNTQVEFSNRSCPNRCCSASLGIRGESRSRRRAAQGRDGAHPLGNGARRHRPV